MYLSIFSKKITTTQGFTLIEVLVSLSLFTVVVTMAVGTLLVLIDANGKQQSAQSVVTNMSFALDSMTREIRTGYFYECESLSSSLTETSGSVYNDCASGATNFAFSESGGSLTGGMDSNRIAYRLNGTAIERRLGNPATNGVNWRAITAPEVVVDTLEFIVTGARPYSDGGINVKSPIVTIFVSGTAGNVSGLDTSFNLQTTVTQQILDI